MPTRNGYAAMVRKRKDKPTGKRRTLDDYETPPEVTEALCDFVEFDGPILEPAAGSGRMARVLRERTGERVTTADVKRGQDFTKRTARWKGDIITNPPYRNGLADAFVQKALELADGRVAMLMELKFLTGSKRARQLYGEFRPERIVLIPGRIYFIAGGKPITSQFFTHCWIVWPPRKYRNANTPTLVNWAIDRGSESNP